MGSKNEIHTPVSLDDDIMQLARLGETAEIKRLYDDGRYDAKYQDDEGITPLHVSQEAWRNIQILLNSTNLFSRF